MGGSYNIQAAVSGEKKVLILGSLAAGKTVLAERYMLLNQDSWPVRAESLILDKFTAKYLQTYGADMYVKTSTELAKPSLQIWVLAGHERYRPLMQQFYGNASVNMI